MTLYKTKIKETPKASIIAIPAAGQLACKRIYFLPWVIDSDTSVLQKSIETFVSNAVEKLVKEEYQSIGFPAIGCGQFGCSIDFVAKTMVGEAYRQSKIHNISVLFVMQPERTDNYNEFEKQINMLQLESSFDKITRISDTVGRGRIEVELGDITKQQVWKNLV